MATFGSPKHKENLFKALQRKQPKTATITMKSGYDKEDYFHNFDSNRDWKNGRSSEQKRQKSEDQYRLVSMNQVPSTAGIG